MPVGRRGGWVGSPARRLAKQVHSGLKLPEVLPVEPGAVACRRQRDHREEVPAAADGLGAEAGLKGAAGEGEGCTPSCGMPPGKPMIPGLPRSVNRRPRPGHCRRRRWSCAGQELPQHPWPFAGCSAELHVVAAARP